MPRLTLGDIRGKEASPVADGDPEGGVRSEIVNHEHLRFRIEIKAPREDTGEV